jgi:hypothetical protein
VDDAFHDLDGQAGAAVGDLADRTEDLVGSGALHQVPDRTRAQHLEHRGSVFERRQRDHPGPGRAALDLTSRARAASGRHLHVHQSHVGKLLLGERDGLVGVGRLADQQHPVLVREQLREGAAQRRLVVGDEDADVGRARGITGKCVHDDRTVLAPACTCNHRAHPRRAWPGKMRGWPVHR